MADDRWRRIESVYHGALVRDADARAAFLAEACGGDDTLRREVESLLAQPATADGFLDGPAVAVAAGMVSDPGVSLMTGRRLGIYQLQGLLGRGGMGEVYRARDTKLGREVAIKILPRAFTSDPDRLARFEREARMLAALNHPNIATIHGLDDTDGVRALVLELVEGETLAEKIARGRLPIPDVLRIARDMADALDAAHEKGIVHRDLKPANIKITPDGVVKVLDFGLAKAGGDGPGGLSQAPTMTIGGTREGTILGTAAYMSPEQARGLPVDKRADLWAFGCVLYELLTGRAAFARDTIADTLAAVVEREPDWGALPETTPPNILRVLRRCLEKDPKRRLRDAGDARIEIEEALTAPAAPLIGVNRPRRGRQRLAWAVAAIAALGALATLYVRPHVAPPEAVRLSVSIPGTLGGPVFISPDGHSLAFSATDASGKSMLWIRPLDSLEARALPGTLRATNPFWSPDGRSLGFFADGKIKKMEVSGGPVQTLADAPNPWGGTWNQNGIIVFAPEGHGLSQVAAAGGVVSMVATLDSARKETGRKWPQFLPDGRHFLYFVSSEQPENTGVYVGTLGSNETKQLVRSDSKGAYAAPGYLLFLRQETLMAQSFDAGRLELSGEPVLVSEGVPADPVTGQAGFSASATGVLAYRNAAISNTQLVWFDRAGKQLGSIGAPARFFWTPELSPDGKRLAIAQGPVGSEDIWLWELAGGTASRFTFDLARELNPLWSPDGNRVVFRSNRSGFRTYSLYQKNASGAGGEDLLFESSSQRSMHPQDWSSDGRFLVYMSTSEKTGFDLWVLPLFGERKAFPYLHAPFHETQAQFSPDGRWMAYVSNESGKNEVYVQSFPTPGSKRQVSSDGGIYPRWRADGKELFYLASDLKLMAAPVTGGTAVEVGASTALFPTQLWYGAAGCGDCRPRYDVTADGRRFILNVPSADSGPPITVVLNWPAVLRK